MSKHLRPLSRDNAEDSSCSTTGNGTEKIDLKKRRSAKNIAGWAAMAPITASFITANRALAMSGDDGGGGGGGLGEG